MTYNPNYATNGWFADTPEFSVADVNVPVSSYFIESDGFCSSQANAPTASSVPTQNLDILFTDEGRTHISMLGANDSVYRNLLVAQLAGASDALDGVCADLVFGDWAA